MIIACINAYQDEDFIWDAIASVAGLDRIVVVDGAYEGFPQYNDVPYSTDQTVEIAEELGCEVIKTRRVWKDQVEKRNAYLIGEVGDWYLQIDADERLHGELKPGNDEAYRIPCQFGKRKIPTLKLFRHQPGIRYIGAHNVIAVGDRIIRGGDILPDCWIEHLSEMRDPDRKKRKKEYYGCQYHLEKAFRQKNGLP